MLAIMADHDIEGHLQVLLKILDSGDWRELWNEIAVSVESFSTLQVSYAARDTELWQLCQDRQIVMITGNRNKVGPDSLEATIQQQNTPYSIPVLTVAEPSCILANRDYAHRVAERLMEYLIDLDNLRGTGRLYLP
mgnify:CR=1 FL=1